MLDREKLREWQTDRENADRQWRADEARAERIWRLVQVVVFGVVGALVAILAALIQRGG